MSATTSAKQAEELDTKKVRAMHVVEAVQYAFSIPRTRGAIILGPPGIGKTENVLRFAMLEARALGKQPVFVNEARASMSLKEYNELLKEIFKNPDKYYVITMVPFGATMPDDLLGVPNLVTIRDEGGVLAVFEESALKASLALLTIPDIYGVLLIDDAMNAHDVVRKSFLQAVFQERLVGGFNGVKLSPNVRVIATGNLTTESEIATPLQKPMVGRAWIGYVKPEPLQSWYRRMEMETKGKWFKEVYAFLKRYEKYYNNPELMDEEMPTGPVPRAWSALAEDFYAMRDTVREWLADRENGIPKLMAVASGYVGTDAAMQLVTFLSKPVPSVEAVEKNPGLLKEIAEDMDLVFRFCIQLAQKVEDAVLKGKGEFKYLGMLTKLMDHTTGDVAVFTYEMLSPKAKEKFKNLIKRGLSSKKRAEQVIARKLLDTLADLAIAETLLEM